MLSLLYSQAFGVEGNLSEARRHVDAATQVSEPFWNTDSLSV